jgi:predicted phosphohydrolase
MFFHIISDIHLEYNPDVNSLQSFITKFPHSIKDIKNYNILKNKNKILIIAGDIGYPTSSNYFEFLKDCCLYYQYVIFTSGNHEYYHGEYHLINNIIETESIKVPNLIFLLNKTFILDNYKFIGTTLWTKIHPREKLYLKGNSNDYNFIKFNEKYLDIDDTNSLNENQYNFILNELQKPNIEKNQKNIVISHHLPSQQLIDEKYLKYGSINKLFYTNYEELFVKENININAWICGHSHSKSLKTINKTKLILNPFGYKNENINNSILEIEL